MKLNLYNVQDVLVGFGESPFGFPDDAQAVRAYEDFLPNSKHPEDMRLFRIGKIDTETGAIEPETPICIQGGGQPHGERNNEIQNTI